MKLMTCVATGIGLLAAGVLALYLSVELSPEKRLEQTFDQRIAQARELPNSTLENLAITQLQAWYDERRGLLRMNSAWKVEHSLDANDLIEQYPVPADAAGHWLASLFFKSYDAIVFRRIDMDLSSPFNKDPLEPLFPTELDWQSASLKDGSVIALQADKEPPGGPQSRRLEQHKPGHYQLIYPDKERTENTPEVVALNGTAQTVVPGQVKVFSFTRGDVGSTQSQGNLSVKLLKAEPNFAEFELVNSAPLSAEFAGMQLDPLLIQAQDRDGNYLKASHATTKPQAQLDFEDEQLLALLQQKKYDPAFINQQQRQLDAWRQARGSHYKKVSFYGELESLKITALDFSTAQVQRQALKTPVYSFKEWITGNALQPMPGHAVVHDDSIAEQTRRYAISQEQMRQSVRVSSEAVSAQYARILFHSDAPFAWSAAGYDFQRSLEFYTQGALNTRGELLDMGLRTFDFDPFRGSITYSPSELPRQPAYATGTMTLLHPKVEKSLFEASALPQGLSVRDNALIIQSTPFPQVAWRFFAKDSSGRYLKKFHQVQHQGKQSEELFQVQYYYGQPTTVEAYQLVDVTPFEYDFEVKLHAPEVP